MREVRGDIAVGNAGCVRKIWSPIEDCPACDRSIALFGDGEFLGIREVANLPIIRLCGVLDFEQCARHGIRIGNDHVVFAGGELEFERRNRSAGLGLDRFEKNDVFEHSSANFVKYGVTDDLSLPCRNHGKAFIVHERKNESLRLAEPHAGLGEKHSFGTFTFRSGELDRACGDEVERLEVFPDLGCGSLCESDFEVCRPTNVEDVHEPLRDARNVCPKERIGLPVGGGGLHEIARRELEVGGLEFAQERLEYETVVHVFDDAVDRIGEFAGFVEVDQQTEVPSAIDASERTLDVACDCRVDVEARRLVGAEGCGVVLGVLVSEEKFASPESSAETDVFVNVIRAEKSRVFAEGDECGVQRECAIVELVAFGEPESERVGTRKNNLHSHPREDVGKHGRCVDEVFHERHFIDEHIPESGVMERLEVGLEGVHRIVFGHFCVCGLDALCGCEGKNRLAEHGRLSRSAEAGHHENAVGGVGAEVFHNGREHVSLLEPLHAFCELKKVASCRDIRHESLPNGRDARSSGGRVGNRLPAAKKPFHFLSAVDERTYAIDLVCGEVAAFRRAVLAPLVVEPLGTADYAADDGAGRKFGKFAFKSSLFGCGHAQIPFEGESRVLYHSRQRKATQNENCVAFDGFQGRGCARSKRRNTRLTFLLVVCSCIGVNAATDGRVDVRALGAVGDGLHDDTATLQQALDKVDEFRRKDIASWGEGPYGCAAPEIVLSKGIYRITRPLVAVRTFTLKGAGDAVIDATSVKGPALYIDRLYRGTIEGLVFRNGESHIAFWTHNDDSASLLIKDCRFENSSKEAIWTESWRSEPVRDVAGKIIRRSEYTGPFEVVRDASGVSLKPLTWKLLAPNSTRFTMHDCLFLDCAAAYRGATDGQSLSRVWFRSSRPQMLPPFTIRTEVQLTDVRILANIPKDFPYGYIDGCGAGGNYVLTRVKARSLSRFGAPLLANDTPPRMPGGKGYEQARHVDIWNCEADSADSPSGAFLDFRRREPALLHVRGCTEARGAPTRLLRIGEIPTDLESMRDAGGHQENNPPLELTHRWLFEENDASLDLQTPAIFAACLESSLPYAAFAGYPESEARIASPRKGSNTVFKASDYGIGIYRNGKADETAELERLFAAAAKVENPIVELPGRTIPLSRTLTLPRRISICGAGRALLRGLNPSNDIFRVAPGAMSLAIDFDNMGFMGGQFAMTASGAGRIHFQNGVFSGNRGFNVAQNVGTLDVTVIDSTIFSPQIAKIDGATFRMRDSWAEFLAKRQPHIFIDNKRGTVVLERIVGVPVTGMDPGKIDRPSGLPEGEYMFWIRNEDGVVRSREVRYGGEFGGIAPLDNYGVGRALIETGFTTAVNSGSLHCIYRNNSPQGRITLSRVLLLGIGWPTPHVGCGVRPMEDWRSGLRLERDRFLN